MLVLARFGWTMAEGFVPSGGRSPGGLTDREGLARRLARTAHLPRQMVPSAAAMIFTVVPTYLAFRMNGGTALLVYLPSAWTGFLGGNVPSKSTSSPGNGRCGSSLIADLEGGGRLRLPEFAQSRAHRRNL
jgi:hypothetical protein